jgi:hypothetical protein
MLRAGKAHRDAIHCANFVTRFPAQTVDQDLATLYQGLEMTAGTPFYVTAEENVESLTGV